MLFDSREIDQDVDTFCFTSLVGLPVVGLRLSLPPGGPSPLLV